MSIRRARVLVAGACSPLGQRLVEAFLALGAHVVAADALRTRLEELRAQVRQHERLFVAECDFGDLPAAQKLLGDVTRDEPLDTAILVVEPSLVQDAAAIAGCGRFLQAVLEVQARSGRVLVVLAEPDRLDAADIEQPPAALLELVVAAVPDAEERGIAVCGVHADIASPLVLERMVALSDPERAAAYGWIAVP